MQWTLINEQACAPGVVPQTNEPVAIALEASRGGHVKPHRIWAPAGPWTNRCRVLPGYEEKRPGDR